MRRFILVALFLLAIPSYGQLHLNLTNAPEPSDDSCDIPVFSTADDDIAYAVDNTNLCYDTTDNLFEVRDTMNFYDGTTDSPKLQFVPTTGDTFSIYAQDDTVDWFHIQSNTANDNVFSFQNIGAGYLELGLNITPTLTAGGFHLGPNPNQTAKFIVESDNSADGFVLQEAVAAGNDMEMILQNASSGAAFRVYSDGTVSGDTSYHSNGGLFIFSPLTASIPAFGNQPTSSTVGITGLNVLGFTGADTADAFETSVIVTEPLADRTFTLPDADSVAGQPITCGGTDKISAVSALGVFTCSTDATGAGGSAIVLDLGDDAADESTDLTEIATTGDTNSIFTEPAADKLLIAVGNNWPTADAATALSANGANCAAGSYALGVDAAGVSESCTDATTEIDSAISTHTGNASAHHTATADTNLTQEEVEDFAGALITDGTGTHTDIAFTYQDATGDVDIVVDTLPNLTGTLDVDSGGTGAVSLTDGGILLGSGTGAVTALGVATNGQIPIGDGTTDPVLATITATANETDITNGVGTITVGIVASPTLDATNITGIVTAGIVDDEILEADLDAIDAASDGECLSYDVGSLGFEWVTCGAGGGAFTDADPIVQNTTTYDVHIGDSAGTLAGKLEVGGDADQPQLVVEGHSAQTDSIVVVQDDADAQIFNIDVNSSVFVMNTAGADSFLYLGDADDTSSGRLWWDDSENEFVVGGSRASSQLVFTYGNGLEAARIDTAGKFLLGDDAENINVGIFDVEGVDANAATGPHSNFYTTGDAFPLFQQFFWGHDNVTLAFDSYYDGTQWESSDLGSNFRLRKASDLFQLDYDENIAAGSAVTWVTAFSVDATTGLFAISDKQDRNNVAVDDDDCTGEQGLWWYDTTDSAFEFCNANSGTPAVLGGGSSEWTDAGTVLHGNETTDEICDDASCTDWVLNDTGLIQTSVGLDAVGAVDMDYGSGDVTDHTFTTDSTGDGEFVVPADSIGSAEIDTIVQSMYWPAGAMSADGTQCADPAEVTLNSGPKQYTVSCTDNASSVVYGQTIMPDGWDAGTVVFEITVWHGTTESITYAGDFSAQCRGDSETVSSTWGTVQSADVSITTANDIEMETTSALTPAGTCAAGDHLWWRWVMDAVASDANAANTDILGVKMEYTTNVGD